ncbi:MAG: glycoside hydrolase family 127 protein, partial [Chitinophagaceae bacterium]
IWVNLVSKKIYVQGGAGAVPDGERYGDNYELPNATAYNETCAAIANVYWNQRMFQLHGESKYIDLLEKILYNGLISGVAMDGKTFFYTNALQVTDHFSHKSLERERAGWFECSCCPTNVARLIPSIPGYVYAQKGNNVFVNLFINSNTLIKVGGKDVEINQKNNYPWDGDLTFNVDPVKGKLPFTLKVRIPGWAQGVAIGSDLYSFVNTTATAIPILVNGQPIEYKIENGYAVIDRTWSKKDIVEVKLPMEVNRVKSNEKLVEDKGKVALQRGPLMYCAEWADNNGKTSNIILPSNATFTASFQPELLNGVMVLKSQAKAVVLNGDDVKTQTQPFIAIPYYSWAHRGKGEMQVWFPEKVNAIDLITQ